MSRTESIAGVGIGYKPVHLAPLLAEPATVDFIEVHAENYMGAGGLPHHELTELRSRLPLSVHGVGLNLAGESPLDATHLARLAALVSRYQPALVSEHLAWSSHAGHFFGDLLPLPYHEVSLERMCRHVDQVQKTLKRQLLLENPVRYLLMKGDTLTEVAFLRALVERTGCALLLDLNNVVVSCHNTGIMPSHYLADFPLPAVAQIHLAGHSSQTLDTGSNLLLDDHGSAISSATWTLYRQTVRRLAVLGRAGIPTLIEWDRELPAWPVLRAEVGRVRHYQQQARKALRTVRGAEAAVGIEVEVEDAVGVTGND
ncbi:DUF692 domain-containing protein [Permianibacter sp. IMCC34836]|uniref:MNIO family bufferin maturase n=1 Tax=Permianibacter fluminis TaxID=2738515 RepID=UPI00155816CB|nr:DUF692 domain-containing protein [Permianibacter fluminis]NQD38001.1 DUF692 domain-containing protein [Permianibacter fluminis]